MKKFLLFLLLNFYIFVAYAQYYPEKGQWKESDPKSVGMDPEKLNNAVQFAIENEYTGEKDLRMAILKAFSREPYHEIKGPVKERGGSTGLIIKDGYVVAKWGDPDRVDMTFSVTKSYLSTVAGLALDQGLINDVNDQVINYVWDDTFEGNHNSQITWHHLLNQSSDWSGSLFGMYDWADRPPSEGGIDDWKNRDLNVPGTTYKYNDVRVNVLAYSLLQVWRKPLPVVLKEHVMDRIEASTTWRWFGYENSWVVVDGLKVQSVTGGGHSGGGIFISSWDHARFGYLFLRNGKWKDQQVISEDWISMLKKSSEANPSYGYMWWLNKGDRSYKGINESVYYAAGFGGNFIVIDEKNDLVIVTRWLEPSKLGEMLNLVKSAI